MPSKLSITLLDNSNEKTTFEIPAASVSAANFDAVASQATALQTAIEGVTIGNVVRRKVLATDTEIAAGVPANKWAQRETKWFVQLRGATTNKIYSREIGTADLSLLADNGEDMADGAAKTALVDALENSFRGDQNEVVTVISVKHVGRNT